MFPISSKRIKSNPLLLGEILPSRSELLDTDPGVAALRMQLNGVRSSIATIAPTAPYRKQVWSEGSKRGDRSRYMATFAVDTKTGMYRDNQGRNSSGRMVKAPDSALYLHKQYLSLKQQETSLLKKLAATEDRVWSRISKAVVYKAFTIQPIIDRAKNSITYQIKKGGANVGAPHQRLDEAKAVIDEDIARGQEAKVQAWAEERGKAEGVLPSSTSVPSQPNVTVQKTMITKPNGGAAAPEVKGSNMGRILLIGGAAAGALLLLR